MYVIVGPPRQPRFNLCGFVGGVVIHDDMDIETFWNARVDLLEKIQKLGGPMTLVAFADHEPRRDIEGSEQRGGSVADIVVGPALRNAGHHWQDRLLAIQRLDLALLIHAEDKRPGGRG